MSKNILILLASRGRGGVEKRFINYVCYLANKNESSHTYSFLVNRNILLDSEYAVLLQSKRVKLITYKNIRIGNLRRLNTSANVVSFYLKVLFLQKKNHFDVVHFSTFTSLHVFKMFRNSKKLVSVYTGFYPSLDYKLKHKLFQQSIYKTHYDCLSPLISDQLISTTAIAPKYVHTSPGSFIDLKNTQTKVEEKENKIVFLGGLNDQKGLNLLVKLIENWDKISGHYFLDILGKGKGKEEVIEKINLLHLNNQIKLSYTDDPKRFLRKSKIFLSLQKGENYPSQSLLEAMACKNAVIATDVGHTYKLVDDSNGIRINNSAESIITGINTIIKKIENDNSLFENSRKKVLNNHSIEQFDAYLSSIYNELYK